MHRLSVTRLACTSLLRSFRAGACAGEPSVWLETGCETFLKCTLSTTPPLITSVLRGVSVPGTSRIIGVCRDIAVPATNRARVPPVPWKLGLEVPDLPDSQTEYGGSH